MRDYFGSQIERRVKMTLLVATELDFRLHHLVRRFESRAVSAALRVGAIQPSGLMQMTLSGSEQTLQAILAGLNISRTKGGVVYYHFAPGTFLAGTKKASRPDTSGPSLLDQLRAQRAPKRPKRAVKVSSYSSRWSRG